MVRWAGDWITFRLTNTPAGSVARLRTTIGRAHEVRREIVGIGAGRNPAVSSAWHDIPMRPAGDGTWELKLPLTEVGWFEAKAFAIDRGGRQHWPHGSNAGIGVQPSWTRSANSIYCAFPRQFGPNKSHRLTADPALEARLKELDAAGYAVIPPGGKIRDVLRELPHIFGTLGCRILHLLPVNPTPTTFARFGRFGSPYAALDLTAIDPALIEFDQRTTGVQQFMELTHAVRCLGGRVMLDMVINHTGWGSTLWERHPNWFHRHGDGRFASPGAWGTVWEDLVELTPWIENLWRELAEAFLTWCRRGVDAFRCDAGYKIPLPVWRFIIARVRQEFPDAVFLLEGLGGSWEATESLLREGGMQWAYSELFQNYGGGNVQWYLDQALRMSAEAGPLIHYSETHDNLRLTCQPPGAEEIAARGQVPEAGRRWSRFRNRLSALTSVAGGWGFTNGVEWLATERVNVHSARGLAWGSADNLVNELAGLNHLVCNHPCYFADATLRRISPDGSAVFAMHRTSGDGRDQVLVVANNDLDAPQSIAIDATLWRTLGEPLFDIAGPGEPERLTAPEVHGTNQVRLRLAPGACHCLSATPKPVGISGDTWREQQARADWALRVWTETAGVDLPHDPHEKWDVSLVSSDPAQWLALASRAAHNALGEETPNQAAPPYINVVRWTVADVRRITPVPPGHWILILDPSPFRVVLAISAEDTHPVRAESIRVNDGWIAAIGPSVSARASGLGRLTMEHLVADAKEVHGKVLFLPPRPNGPSALAVSRAPSQYALLTNGRGGMARLCADLGRIHSKYDCLLGANLHDSVPVDRHVFVKRMRAWAQVDGFISPLDANTLEHFETGDAATWRFVVRGGNRQAHIQLRVGFIPGRNTVVVRAQRLDAPDVRPAGGPTVDPGFHLIVRFDLEDRSYHGETRRNGGAEHHFTSNTRSLHGKPGVGFRFQPAPDRHIQIHADHGQYHEAEEWSQHVPHSVEASRGQEANGDAWSPGWFEVPLSGDAGVTFVVDADPTAPAAQEIAAAPAATPAPSPQFAQRLTASVRQFVVRRGEGRTVIAGYPWFLDWGRDTLIACRGLLAAGMIEEVHQILLTFARFEKDGTLPNAIHGEDASNRDTSDAQLWFGVVCEEFADLRAASGGKRASFYEEALPDGRTIRDVLRSIACGYLDCTPNGIRVDAASGLVWSPSHFTWMDTNHPPGTPREGYPVEIQALWIRLLRQLGNLQCAPWGGRGESWADLAQRAEKCFHQYFWLEECGWYADVLLGGAGHPARTAPPSNALRSNALLPIALGIDRHPKANERARRTVEAARQWLLIPGALRSLAPLPVIPPLPVRGNHGGLLNDPNNPYWPHYEGDEDTRRKPAYHNGTAWGWTFPSFCEALVQAYPDDPWAAAAARAYLASVEGLLSEGCVNHLPEILDGDAPHTQRGCDAQAWSVTEALRVWVLLEAAPANSR